ncbi:MAG: DUF3822 family protein [Prevotellaceae bacterium]|jgi:hypothetical protein|nr:DUF3822 family protein [Prevotellaceae bacterium]
MTETIDFSKSEQYKLSIRIDADGFSFAVFNPQNEKISYFDRATNEELSLTANMRQAFREMEWLGHPFAAVNVLVAGQRFTPMPLDLFEDEQVETLFYYNLPKQNNEWVHYNIMKRSNVVMLFGMDKSLHDLLCEQHPEGRFYAQASVLVEEFAARSYHNDSRKLYVYVHAGAVDLYAFDAGRVQLTNSFACRQTADRLYYMLYTWKQLGFDQERDELYLCGDLSDDDRLSAELQQYIRQVYTLSPAHHLDLYAISICG